LRKKSYAPHVIGPHSFHEAPAIPAPPAHPPLILASASPRRAELLAAAGIPFTVVVSPAPEPERKPAGIPVDLWPMCLAHMKASAVQGKLKTQHPKSTTALILAADTIVVDGQRILNKARSRAHARAMLASLRGKTHRVITGVALLCGDRVRLTSATALCRVRRVSDAFLARYLDSGLWRGKAGAYGIQDAHDPFITLLAGDITTVIGLPIPLVRRELASFREDVL
jgi:septum formation protein